MPDCAKQRINAALRLLPRSLRPLARDDKGQFPADDAENSGITYTPPSAESIAQFDPTEAYSGPELKRLVPCLFEFVERTGFGGTLLSVFTHLTLEEQKRLVDEFRRLLRPGGYVYVSFHGEYFYPTMFARLDDAEKIFERDVFLIEKQQLEGSNDCFTLHSPESLVRLFAGFDLLKHYRSTHRGPTDAAAWQDSMIFRLGVQS